MRFIYLEYTNLLDNLGVADLNAIWTLGASNTGNQISGLNTASKFQNKAVTEIGRVGMEVITRANLISTSIFNKELQFVNYIKRIGRIAKMTSEQIWEQVICDLNSTNQYNIRMMAKFHNTLENITKALAEAEKFILIQGQAGTPSSFSIAQLFIIQPEHYTDADIEKLVEE
ncbi:hypothetical protein RhiirA4_453001 [Rhizophagus irregularis]|uniref:Uncharacterized protein n=1 Tax=Rhizophagus irregularis TaxID=588596 RepID=A0A2I1FZF1_9GLOM|nr:hypothetical protein RhiirA4_453001 [Rhizophagus irregularis]